MLRGSAVVNRCIGTVWDTVVPQRRGHGFYQRTGQAARAQGQTRGARKGLRWVRWQRRVQNASASPKLSLPTVAASTSWPVSHCFLSLVPQWSLALALRLLVSVHRFLFWLLIDWPWADASWDTEKGRMSIVSPGQTLQPHAYIINNWACAHAHTRTHTHAHYSYTCASYTCIFFFFYLTELFCLEKDLGRGHISPVSTRLPMSRWTVVTFLNACEYQPSF